MEGRKRKAVDLDSDSFSVSTSTIPPTINEPRTQNSSGLKTAVDDRDRHNEQSMKHGLLPITYPGTFTANASIVLIGTRGVGKSTLAIIGSDALHRRLIECDAVFKRRTGHNAISYRKTYGLDRFKSEELNVMRDTLHQNETGCIIVCGPGCLQLSGQLLLRDYAKTHPVILISRDLDALEKCMEIPQREIKTLLKITQPLYRSCSNYEFFNLSVTISKDAVKAWEVPETFQTSRYTSTLKDVKHDFVRFLELVIGNAPALASDIRSLFLHASETRHYTTALQLPISLVSDTELDTCDLDGGIDAIELIVPFTPQDDEFEYDSFRTSIGYAFAKIRRITSIPIILRIEQTYSESSNTITSDGHLPTYHDSVISGLGNVPAYMALDLKLSDNEIQHIHGMNGCTRLLGYYHDEKPEHDSWVGEKLMPIIRRAISLKLDAMRITQLAACVNDNFTCLDFIRRVHTGQDVGINLIAYNTGAVGRLSQIYSCALIPVWHPKLKDNNDPEQKLSVEELNKELLRNAIYQSLRFSIIGASVDYSLSPALQNAGFKYCGLAHTYEIDQTNNVTILQVRKKEDNFGGASISLPFKSQVMSMLDSLSSSARVIGAVNTVLPVRHECDGSIPSDPRVKSQRNRRGPVVALYGDNVDWIGIHNCVSRNLSPANAVKSDKTTALIAGAGGMARASIYALAQLGVSQFLVYNRTIENAECLASHYRGMRLLPVEHPNSRVINVDILENLDSPWPPNRSLPCICVCTIPAHQIGLVSPPNFTIPGHWLRNATGGVVVELSYKTANTPLLKQVRSLRHRGWIAVHALDVLTEQAFVQFKLFTGMEAPREVMREAVNQQYAIALESQQV